MSSESHYLWTAEYDTLVRRTSERYETDDWSHGYFAVTLVAGDHVESAIEKLKSAKVTGVAWDDTHATYPTKCQVIGLRVTKIERGPHIDVL